MSTKPVAGPVLERAALVAGAVLIEDGRPASASRTGRLMLWPGSRSTTSAAGGSVGGGGNEQGRERGDDGGGSSEAHDGVLAQIVDWS
ncbi:hypothetical protein [Streptomyces sp. NPDC058145]|uniref:hypothetical protein n=1 Tax=Streptomyces sp. NPDC058145 TaxID=3346356 RepID=UPI0036E1694C